MAETVPPWLVSGFVRAATNLGATATREALESLAQELASRWSTPGRHFHNLNHLKDTLENIDFLAEQARDIDALRLAVWFHGSAFDVSEKAIEKAEDGIDIPASAKFAREQLCCVGIPTEVIDRIVSLIESLRHRSSSEDIDAQVLSDADLAVLGSDPEDYLSYLKAIRAEYATYSDSTYLKARLCVVEGLLARPQLFYTHMTGAWEDQARENLRAEQERLQKSLSANIPLIPPTTTEAEAESETEVASVSLDSSVVEPNEHQDSEEDINPFVPNDEADLGSTLENVEEIMDTLAMKAIKTEETTLKPMTDPKK